MILRYLSLILFAGILVFSSCVPNKKILYLQSEGELDKDFPVDTVLREYKMGDYEYRIQPEDILSIRIESLTEEEFNIFANDQENIAGANQANLALSGYLVDKDGNIHFSEIGVVKVTDLTIHQIESKLNDLISQYVEKPAVKVRLMNFRISVLGEVNQEGIVSSFENRMSILEAVARAGGVTDLADRVKVKVIRQLSGRAKVMYVNLLHEELLDQSNFFVHPNDIIIVPPLKQRPFRNYFGQNLTLVLSSVSVLLLTINVLND
ncbi:MAG: polysaccharide biosynthesis/export family protein [Bacteroidota bacterium]